MGHPNEGEGHPVGGAKALVQKGLVVVILFWKNTVLSMYENPKILVPNLCESVRVVDDGEGDHAPDDGEEVQGEEVGGGGAVDGLAGVAVHAEGEAALKVHLDTC